MDPFGDGVTIVNILLAAQGYLTELRDKPQVTIQNRQAGREFAIAITAVEDAIMRTNRGFALAGDTYRVADVQQQLLAEEAAFDNGG